MVPSTGRTPTTQDLQDVELQQKGERLEAKVLELAQKWRSEGHCGEPGSPLINTIDEMAWDTEGLPWPGLTVPFDPTEEMAWDTEGQVWTMAHPPVDIVADEALSPGKAYRSDTQMVSKDWPGIAKEGVQSSVDRPLGFWVQLWLGSGSGRREVPKRKPQRRDR
ncbi:hypothetical protein AAFF_G00209650 [Aldrovandia affinis]|uniref:Uncharacterized protein n=1 Tax=Aldrovandia affinis TaxID=143900 RepID=A0AAD7SW56_9TELE|nr:hypothetical protein AAFF_G00209650 [Aldrovandia affinis]